MNHISLNQPPHVPISGYGPPNAGVRPESKTSSPRGVTPPTARREQYSKETPEKSGEILKGLAKVGRFALGVTLGVASIAVGAKVALLTLPLWPVLGLIGAGIIFAGTLTKDKYIAKAGIGVALGPITALSVGLVGAAKAVKWGVTGNSTFFN